VAAAAGHLEVSVAFEASRSPRYYDARSFEEDPPVTAAPPHIVAISIDTFADAALARVRDGLVKGDVHCDACEALIEGEPFGRGVFVTTRGEETRYEEPLLCPTCATAIGLRANRDMEIEDES
jgi:hypothetical protein